MAEPYLLARVVEGRVRPFEALIAQPAERLDDGALTCHHLLQPRCKHWWTP